MARLKLSPPGIIILSPTVSPEIEMSRDSSRYLVPVILIPAMVNSFGVLELGSARSSGSTETGCVVSVTWASTELIFNKQQAASKTQISSRLRIQVRNLERQIKGIYTKCLLKNESGSGFSEFIPNAFIFLRRFVV